MSSRCLRFFLLVFVFVLGMCTVRTLTFSREMFAGAMPSGVFGTVWIFVLYLLVLFTLYYAFA